MLSLIDKIRSAGERRVGDLGIPQPEFDLSSHAAGGCPEHRTFVRTFFRIEEFHLCHKGTDGLTAPHLLGRRVPLVPVVGIVIS